MPSVINAPKVRITVFNVDFFKNAPHSGRVTWTDAASGKLIKRNRAGRFCSVPFVVVAQQPSARRISM